MYKSIFLRTAGVLALTALLAAQSLEWTEDALPASGAILGWSLLAAIVGGLIAVGWAFVKQPATTALGRAFRASVQALLGAPIAGLIVESRTDLVSASGLVVPTIAAVLIAFGISYLGNLNPVVHDETPSTASDFLGRSA